MMSKLLRKAEQLQRPDTMARYQKFGLSDNPFPSEPYVNQDSTDKRVNGGIYETEIHINELHQVINNFIKKPQSDQNHLRLGYIIDTSYIGRGNGKSAFLLKLKQTIDNEYCLDLSDDKNKCFAIYFSPELGGRTKTFPSFVDIFYQAIVRSGIIQNCLATLRLESIKKVYSTIYNNIEDTIESMSDEDLITLLNDEEWFSKNSFDNALISDEIYKHDFLQQLPSEFPLFRGRNSWIKPFISLKDFTDYYTNNLKRSSDRITFVFSHLVNFFISAGFNGAYVFVDDFERVPDFQSERQKRDFALELRSCLFDGVYTNAKLGFYNFLLVLHAGVPRLIGDAWSASGMEHRAPIMPKVSSKHVIRFEKLSKKHASLLIKKYLAEYRIEGQKLDPLYPFDEGAVQKIGELLEYNAAKILKMANELLEKATELEEVSLINSSFISKNLNIFEDESISRGSTTKEVGTLDLQKKAKGKKK
ncbi:hypothetical protein ACFLRP_00240 [Bacteroidota bacterium]